MRVGVVQCGVAHGNVETNVTAVCDWIRQASHASCDLVVLPECVLTGYVFESREEVEAHAVALDGPELEQIVQACSNYGMHAVFGTFERLGDQLHNAALLVGPSGLIGVHRKNHLPFLGGDRFVDLPPNPTPSIFDTAVGKIGIAICYEIRFPEVARTLTLGGAEIIALPTNWPMASRILAEAFTSVRAAENMVYFIASNRNDSECGVQYLGMSRIVDPIGNLVGDAETNTALIIADLDMRIAQTKKIIFESGKFEISPIKDRRPESYRM